MTIASCFVPWAVITSCFVQWAVITFSCFVPWAVITASCFVQWAVITYHFMFRAVSGDHLSLHVSCSEWWTLITSCFMQWVVITYHFMFRAVSGDHLLLHVSCRPRPSWKNVVRRRSGQTRGCASSPFRSSSARYETSNCRTRRPTSQEDMGPSTAGLEDD